MNHTHHCWHTCPPTQEATAQLLAAAFGVADAPQSSSTNGHPVCSTAEEEQLWAELRALLRNAFASAGLTSLASMLGLLLAFAHTSPSKPTTRETIKEMQTARRTPHTAPAPHARYARFASILSEGLCIALHKARQDLVDMLLWHGADPFILQTGAHE